MTRNPETTTERVKSVLGGAFAHFHLWLVGGVSAYLFWYAFTQPEIGMSARPVEAFFGGVALLVLVWAAKLSAEKSAGADAV
ncbi:hypothetical protein [Halorarius litoreus]|uniref:hypothetical protein n=1 Tax=Halorarius litoreus TaxID=2962676 RepID=UPI0020CC9C88|nr:hypothetical protein [Halorarius litoreus]